MKDSFNDIFAGKIRILTIMPHPDDLELYCGGTVARLLSLGKTVRTITMTYGEMGSRGQTISSKELESIRKLEDKNAKDVFKIPEKDRIYLDLGDGQVNDDNKTIELLAYQIREFKPELIITTNPEDYIIRFAKGTNWFNHTDHIHTARAAITASYPFSRDTLFFPEQLKINGLDSHSCVEFLFSDFFNHEDSVFIEVTDFLNTRIKAHAMHSSQYSVEDATDSADFFTACWDKTGQKKYETFRYVIAD